MTYKKEGATAGGMTYGDSQHIHAPKAFLSYVYTYDANGNLAGRGGSPPVVYVFDAENRLTAQNDSSGFDIRIAHSYDAGGERVRRRSYSVAYAGAVSPYNEHFMDGLYEERASHCELPSARTNYYQAFGRTFAQRKTTSSTSSVTYLLADHLNSTVGSINASGAVTTNKYYPYGAPRTSASPSSIAFTGQRRENQSYGGFEPYYPGSRPSGSSTTTRGSTRLKQPTSSPPIR